MRTATFDLMAEKSRSSLPPSSFPSPPLSTPSQLNGRIRGARPKHPTSQSPPPSHHNGCVPSGVGGPSPMESNFSPKLSPGSSAGGAVSIPSPRAAQGCNLSPEGPSPKPVVVGSSPISSCSRPRGKSLGSSTSSMGSSPSPRPRVGTTSSFPRIMGLWNKARSSQKEETTSPVGSSPRSRASRPDSAVFSAQTEELLELIVESQSLRLNDQRASLSLVPDPDLAALSGPGRLCGACCLELHPELPSQEFFNMLIQYQSSRIEDQRCSLPDLDEVVGSTPEGQEDFFGLIQRLQARRMDEQRALLLTHTLTASNQTSNPDTRQDPASNQASTTAASNPPSNRACSSSQH